MIDVDYVVLTHMKGSVGMKIISLLMVLISKDWCFDKFPLYDKPDLENSNVENE